MTPREAQKLSEALTKVTGERATVIIKKVNGQLFYERVDYDIPTQQLAQADPQNLEKPR